MKLNQPLEPRNNFAILEAFRLLYEDMDLQRVETKLVDFLNHTFEFDRTAFFFVKHGKKVLQGKLARGFDEGAIRNIHASLYSDSGLLVPIHTGNPLRVQGGSPEGWERELGLTNYVLVPIINRRHSACWEHSGCEKGDCVAFAKKWRHCWLIPGFDCCMKRAEGVGEGAFSCTRCPMYRENDLSLMEGVLLADNSLSGRAISSEDLATLAIIADAVGRSINNSKLFGRALHDAVSDFLTGLYNRRYFNSRVGEEVSRSARYGDPLCLIFADIDLFKTINDTFGHAFGDMVLQRIGETLRTNLRKGDIAARYGGEEFAILLTSTALPEALLVAEKIRAAIEETDFAGQGAATRATMSFGVSALTWGNPSSEDLFRNADIALYAAKTMGRNRVCEAPREGCS